MNRSILASAALLGLSGAAFAQAIPVPLAYNFNGIVHAGEAGLPDDPNGYRSISDRGLDFTLGVPNDTLLNAYQLIGSAGALDIVHLGNRDTVDGGNRAFQATANGDDIGIQPAWLLTVDQSTPQTTVLQTPLPITNTTSVAFLYQISNGGGAFDVTFTFLSTNTHTATLSGGDWFGGTYAGTANTDNGFGGNNLSITEGRIDMSAFDGEVVSEIAFSNRSNQNAGYAILACNFEYPLPPSRVNQIPLNYNFNGVVHAGESGNPDDLVGFRAISDRALDFSNGIPADPLLAEYQLVDQPLALDMVHLGNRDTVDGGARPFDAVANGDDFGVQPAWLLNVDQTGPQTTTLADAIRMDATSSASVLFQISNGGGAFDVEFTFASGAPVVATISGPDWFGGTLPGTGNTDNGLPSANLSLTERTIDLSAQTGRVLTAVTFLNRTNLNAGYAVLGLNVVGCIECANGASAVITNLGGGTSGSISTASTGNLGCDLDWTVSGGTPNAFGLWALGEGTTAAPLSLITPGCPGTIHTPNPILITSPLDALGASTFVLPLPPDQALCGYQVTGQYVTLAPGPCFLVLSDALAITIGN
ncbi:MAG: hypothetical protein ACE37K_09435 [Planctomycetota bacterium]